jgi:cytochrome c biogenesis protein CcdA
MFLFFVGSDKAAQGIPVQFLWYEPCDACPGMEIYYQAYQYNAFVANNIARVYGKNVSVRWIEFYSTEGKSIREQHNLSAVDWNSIVVNHEVVLRGGDQLINLSYACELIDFYLMPPALVHDVAITSVVSASNTVVGGDSLGINITIRNEGTEVEDPNVTLFYTDNVIHSMLIGGMSPGEERLVSFEWNTTQVAIGNYTISARIDPVQNETDAADNLYYDGVIEVRERFVPPTVRHDIAVISVVPSNASANVGEKVNITTIVKNVGTESESFDVDVYCNESLIGSEPVSALVPNQTRSVTLLWDTVNRTSGDYIIRAHAIPVANETYLADNERIYSKIVLSLLPPDHQDGQDAPLTLVAMIALAFFFGFFETFSPCLIIMLSFILSYTISKATRFRASFAQVMIFGLGFVSAAMLLGLAFGVVFLSMQGLQVFLTGVVSVIAILLGLNLLGLLKVPLETKPLIKSLSTKYVVTYLGLLFLGFIFYFLDPCIAPIFVSMVPILSSDYLILILAVFALGAIIPFTGFAVFAGSVSRFSRSTYRHRFLIRGISGLVLICYAVYLIAQVVRWSLF